MVEVVSSQTVLSGTLYQTGPHGTRPDQTIPVGNQKKLEIGKSRKSEKIRKSGKIWKSEKVGKREKLEIRKGRKLEKVENRIK